MSAPLIRKMEIVNPATDFAAPEPRFSLSRQIVSACLLALTLVAGHPCATRAADDGAAVAAGKLTVKVDGVADDLLANVLGYLEINQFNGKPAPSRARLSYLHRQARLQIARALQPFGYYHPEIEAGLKRSGDGWLAHYRVTPGEPVIVESVDLKITGQGRDDPEFAAALKKARKKLRPGKPLDQAAYEALKKRLQVLASQRGYFDVEFKASEIRIDLPKNTASIRLHYETGQRYHLGEVHFHQPLEWIRQSLLERYVRIEPGQPYDARDLQQLQSDLSNSDYYAEVEIIASPESAKDHVIPVEVRLKPRNPRKYVLGIGYGTDTGVRGKIGVTGRRVNRLGHHFNAELLVSQIKYGIAGEYIIPGKDPRNDAWGIRGSYEEEHSESRDYKAWNVGGYFRYRDGLWLKTYALDYRVEQFEVSGQKPTSTLLIPSVDWSRTFPPELEKRIYARSGTWLQLRLRGASESLLSDTSFVQPLASAKWIHSFGDRSRVIARGALGSTWVDDFAALPTSLRFFSGGDRTIRGYQYSIIGPADANGDITGGKHLTEGSLEYEFPIRENWSLALFYDVGDAFNDQPEYKAGVGFGIHWRSPIGPVRIDFGHGLDRPPGDRFRFHLTIGPDL